MNKLVENLIITTLNDCTELEINGSSNAMFMFKNFEHHYTIGVLCDKNFGIYLTISELEITVGLKMPNIYDQTHLDDITIDMIDLNDTDDASPKQIKIDKFNEYKDEILNRLNKILYLKNNAIFDDVSFSWISPKCKFNTML